MSCCLPCPSLLHSGDFSIHSCLCLHEKPTQTPFQDRKGSLSVTCPYALLFPAPVEEAGPLKTGLLASNPEHRGDPNDQGHEILHEEQDQIWTAHLSDLGREKRRKRRFHDPSWLSAGLWTHLNHPSLPRAKANIVRTPLFPGSTEHDRERCTAQCCLRQKAQLL